MPKLLLMFGEISARSRGMMRQKRLPDAGAEVLCIRFHNFTVSKLGSLFTEIALYE
jgi:hypothetical protein